VSRAGKTKKILCWNSICHGDCTLIRFDSGTLASVDINKGLRIARPMLLTADITARCGCA
jgi:hypothetical protein